MSSENEQRPQEFARLGGFVITIDPATGRIKVQRQYNECGFDETEFSVEEACVMVSFMTRDRLEYARNLQARRLVEDMEAGRPTTFLEAW